MKFLEISSLPRTFLKVSFGSWFAGSTKSILLFFMLWFVDDINLVQNFVFIFSIAIQFEEVNFFSSRHGHGHSYINSVTCDNTSDISLLFKLALAILWEILSSLFFVSTLIVPNEYLTIPFIQTYTKLSLAACLLTQIHSHKSFCGWL